MYKERIESKLREKFDPVKLIVDDESDQHAGHVGARPEGETHFYVEICAQAFKGMTRVHAQRAVMTALKVELEEHVHALRLKVTSE